MADPKVSSGELIDHAIARIDAALNATRVQAAYRSHALFREFDVVLFAPMPGARTIDIDRVLQPYDHQVSSMTKRPRMELVLRRYQAVEVPKGYD